MKGNALINKVLATLGTGSFPLSIEQNKNENIFFVPCQMSEESPPVIAHEMKSLFSRKP